MVRMTRRVAIVGAGVVGLSCAYYALKRGWQVTVIERNPESRDGCSFGNAGMIVPSHFVPLAAPGMVALGLKWMWNPESPFYIKPRLDLGLLSWAYRFWRSSTKAHVNRSAPLIRDLSFASRQCFHDLETNGLSFGLKQNGLLMLCRTTEGLDEESHSAARATSLGIPAEVLDPSGLAKLDPNVTMSVIGGVWYPKDCHLSPQRYVTELQSAIRREGGKLLWETSILGWRKEAGKLCAAETSVGDIEADEFVLCGGSWSPEIAQPLNLGLPMQAGKGYSLTLSQPRQMPSLCSIFTEARIAVTPMGDQLRFGGTMELCGIDETINRRRVNGIIRAIPNYYPEFQAGDFESIAPWQGLRPCSPDGLPYIGRTRRWDNLVIASGHAMMGLSLAPITGQIVSETLCGERSDLHSTLLSPDRFG